MVEWGCEVSFENCDSWMENFMHFLLHNLNISRLSLDGEKCREQFCSSLLFHEHRNFLFSFYYFMKSSKFMQIFLTFGRTFLMLYSVSSSGIAINIFRLSTRWIETEKFNFIFPISRIDPEKFSSTKKVESTSV